MSDFLKINRNGQILEIVLDRPKANALDAPASREMGRLFADFRDDPNLKVAILTGAGQKFFSAGWDLNAVADGEAYLGDFGEGGFGGFPEMTDLLKPVSPSIWVAFRRRRWHRSEDRQLRSPLRFILAK